jgi:DGQHR domain-containing protein
MLSINRRLEGKDEGYQRVLSNARVSAVANHIRSGQPIPNTILVGLDAAKFNKRTSNLTIPAGSDVGWVIDGQHRLAGAHEASSGEGGNKKVDIELSVIAFIGTTENFQIEQFVTVNREAKGVPTALVYDLLKHLPGRKNAGEVATERAAEIANEVRLNKDSVFYQRIVVTTSPRQGQISITNFVRKMSPHVHPDRGILRVYTLPEQRKILENYFDALRITFPEQWRRADNVFFRTIGFGAMMNMFEEIFQHTISTREASFKVEDIAAVLQGVRHFEFDQWLSYGSGTKAELEAAQDFRTDFKRAQRRDAAGGLKL